MAKEKNLLNLEALLRVRKMSVEDFVARQVGATLEDKIKGIYSSFKVSEGLDASFALMLQIEANKKIKAEDKKAKKKKIQEEEEVAEIKEEKVSSDT